MITNQLSSLTPNLRIIKFDPALNHPRTPRITAQIVHIPSGRIVAEFVDSRIAELFLEAAKSHDALIQHLEQLGSISQEQAKQYQEMSSAIDVLRPLNIETPNISPDELKKFHELADSAEKYLQMCLNDGDPIVNPFQTAFNPGQSANNPSSPPAVEPLPPVSDE